MDDGTARSAVTVHAREIVDGSRTMVAWSIARLLATDPALRPRPPARVAGVPAPADILLGILASPCDLDVLLFAQRHPRALLRIDDIARAVGHGVADVRASLDALTATGLITARETGAEHPDAEVAFYEFTPGAWDAIVRALAWVAASAEGRHALRRALSHRPPAGAGPHGGTTMA